MIGQYPAKMDDKSRLIVPAKLREELGLSEQQKTTPDQLFTVETVSCLGACGLAPALTVNGEGHPAMTPDKASELLKQLKEEAKENA